MRSSRFFRVNAADHQRLEAHHRQFRTVGRGQFGDVIAGEAHTHRLRLFQTFIELEATGVQVNRIAADGGGAGAIAHGFAAIAEGIEFGEEIVLAELLSDEQLERACVHLGRDGPALAGELLLHHGIEVNGKAGEHYKADQAEFNGPAQPWAEALGWWFFLGTGDRDRVMAADYTHFIDPQQARAEVCVRRASSHNGRLEFPRL